ncbi:MAG: hypothetical protein JST90_06355 [Bacteroidetes bacterium]|nr:hypothetical protein [Bacteroidota bacterium]
MIKPAPGATTLLSDARIDGLQGAVRQTITQKYSSEAIERGVAPVWKQTVQTDYSRAGAMTGSRTSFPGSNKLITLSRTFGPDGRVQADFMANSDTSYFLTREYKYDTAGTLREVYTESQSLGSGRATSQKIFDRYGRCTKEDMGGMAHIYLYDAQGHCVTQIDSMYMRGEVEWSYHTYNERNQRISTLKVAGDTTQLTYEYGSNDSLKAMHETDIGSGATSDILYSYDSLGIKIHTTVIRTTYGKGLGNSNMDVDWLYEYDDRGNWITRLSRISGAISVKEERRILYY